MYTHQQLSDGLPGAHLPVEDENGDWIAANLPRYALPNTTSLLPEYANAEAEFIHRWQSTPGRVLLSPRSLALTCARRLLLVTVLSRQ